mmetsp:Transcript_27449/g.45930  ORF Transcript_27449/g.45930 Transcript_27449/m.45930 type:complete len:225 (+) Transcript_27449:1460-2134(+)
MQRHEHVFLKDGHEHRVRNAVGHQHRKHPVERGIARLIIRNRQKRTPRDVRLCLVNIHDVPTNDGVCQGVGDRAAPVGERDALRGHVGPLAFRRPISRRPRAVISYSENQPVHTDKQGRVHNRRLYGRSSHNDCVLLLSWKLLPGTVSATASDHLHRDVPIFFTTDVCLKSTRSPRGNVKSQPRSGTRCAAVKYRTGIFTRMGRSARQERITLNNQQMLEANCE